MVGWLRTYPVLALRGLILVLALAAMPLLAQQSGAVTGGLNGTVIDSSSAVVGDATITLAGPQGTRVIKSDAAGHYSISGLVPGFYDATVEKTGFKKVKSVHNEVVVSVSSLLNFTLPVGNAEETVEVTAQAIGIDTESTAVDANLTDTFYNSIPMPRQVSAIFYAAPGVAGGQVAGTANQAGPGSSNPSIGGSTGLENLYVVDGVTITDQAYGSLGTYNVNHGSLGTGINLAFIKEVDVKSYGFGPQFGKAQGGIVQMVTKSGSNNYHGALAAYLGPGAWYADRYQFYQYGYTQTTPSITDSTPHYDLAAEFGGYIPHFRDKIFFFGAFNPSLDQAINLANPNIKNKAVIAHGPFAYSTTALSWAGKLTFQLSPKFQFEVASFGDPSRHNSVPNTLSTANLSSSLSSWQYGSRDSLARVNAVITPSWIADASYTYNYDHFNETPAFNIYGISDQSLLTPLTPGGPARGATVASGFGSYFPSKEDTYSLAVNTQKTAHFFGQHTIGVGYSYDHTRFLYEPLKSGNLFPIPAQNAAGQTLTTLYKNIPASAPGQLSNGSFTVAAINSSDVNDNTCTQCPIWNGERVYASETRGTYVGLHVNSLGRYHAAYGNDTWEVNRFVTLDGGVRWEEQRVGGTLLKYPFTGNWSPRVGINVDPFGDRKGKVFFNFGRNYWAMPLDAANRQLGNEQDDRNYYFAPDVSSGSLVIVPDAAHTLNGLPKNSTGATFGAPNFSSSTGEGIIPGTKSEYEDEYVLGIEREIKSGLVVKARWVDRRLGRIIEDIGSQSPEGSTIGANYNGGIANPGPGTDIAVNDQEVTYTPAQFAAANPNASAPKFGTAANPYTAPVAGCTAKNDTYFSAGGIWVDGNNKPIGGACFLNLATMDAGPGDGKPDGFAKPVRRYQALELEFDKRYSNHWLAVVNYRYANLWGNYEGAYRNDNGQSDPGISSLFDFTSGALGLLGDQFRPGWLSTDRRSVGNLFLSYTIASDSPWVHAAKGLTVGMGVRGQSGVPLSFLGDHPAYLDPGEVPIGGRGAAGRTPASAQMDLKGEYALHIHESKVLKLALDAFNVTNSQFITGKVQYTQQTALAPPVVGTTPALNTDYGRPTSFQGPFYARATIRFEF